MGILEEKGTKKTWFYLLEGKISLNDLDYSTKFELWNAFYSDIVLFMLLRKKYFPEFAPKNKSIEFIENIFNPNSNSVISYLVSDLYNEGEFGSISAFNHYMESCILSLLREIHDDKLKKESFFRSNSEIHKRAILLSIDDTDELCELLEGIDDSEFLIRVTRAKTSEKVKLKVISLLNDSDLKLSIACELKSDDNKEKVFDQFTVKQQASLICTFDSDDKKFDFLQNNVLTKELKTMVILSLKDEGLRRDILMQMYSIEELSIYSKEYVYDPIIYDAKEDTLPETMTFGVEIEAEGEMAKIICGCAGKLLESWDVKKDASIRDGVEFSSPILQFNEADIKEIYKVCNFAVCNNLESTKNCAGHLHIGDEVLNSPEAWYWLYYIYSKCEKIFYAICNEPGCVPRECVSHFAPPVSSIAENIFKDGPIKGDLEDTYRELKLRYTSRYSGINVTRTRFDTVEFRAPNGSLNPDVIVQNMLLYGNLMKLARNLSLLPFEKEKHEIIKALDNDEFDDEKRFELLMKLLFRSEINREVFRERFKSNYYSFIVDGYHGFYRGMQKKMNLKSENIII